MHVDLEHPLLTSTLNYHLPPELIAKYPEPKRDASRLLVVERRSGTWQHQRFTDLSCWLRGGDAVVLNCTRVRRARTPGTRTSGGRVELLWLERLDDSWRAMARPAGRLRVGETLHLEHGLQVTVAGKEEGGMLRVSAPAQVDMEKWLAEFGHVPLPPYLGRDDEPADTERYQTVFARELGAVAAPTAGLHFTSGSLEDLKKRGVTVAELVLHVGPGTFKPIQTDTVAEHKIDPEWYHIPLGTHRELEATRRRQGRILATGTTVVRTLETAFASEVAGPTLEGWSDLLIAPPFEFKMVDALLTNFHLPGSSLLALVAAFAGLELTMAAYREAVESRYRFYSYGDAMLIL